MSLLSEGFQKLGHQVSVITIAGTGSDFYRLPDGTRRLALDLASSSSTSLQGIRNNLRRLRRLRRAVISTDPGIVISHINQTNVLTLFALVNTGYPVIAVEHSAPGRNSRSPIWRLLRRLTYPQLSHVVSVSEGILENFDWLPQSRKSVIHNPVKVADGDSGPITLNPTKKWIAAMGRLIHVKGYDRLLRAFEKVAQQHPDWQLLIMGKGELKPDLAQLTASLGLSDRVYFSGLVRNPFPLLRSCELFVMASRSEGFPYALLEAMACGLPSVAMDCSSGPEEIIRHGLDGLLVPDGDIDALANAMDGLMSNEPERKRLANRAKDVSERFSLEKIVAQWEELFREVLSQTRREPL